MVFKLALFVIGAWIVTNISFFVHFNFWGHEAQKAHYKKHHRKMFLFNAILWIIFFVVLLVIDRLR